MATKKIVLFTFLRKSLEINICWIFFNKRVFPHNVHMYMHDMVTCANSVAYTTIAVSAVITRTLTYTDQNLVVAVALRSTHANTGQLHRFVLLLMLTLQPRLPVTTVHGCFLCARALTQFTMYVHLLVKHNASQSPLY